MKALIHKVVRVSALLSLVVLTASPVFAQGGGGGRGGGDGRGGGRGTQDVVGGGGTQGRQTAPPKPAPRNANGRAILG
ncbi:MAG TPA: hypothetical protein VIR54_29360, partial [Vicinamibacterales bacterium]